MTVIDNSVIEDNSIKKADICIIGSGMSAQILAFNLKNKKIIMVESGNIKYKKENQTLNEYEQKGILFRENYANRIRQLGGSANLWANQLMILKENDIKNRDWVSKDFSWPFTYDELKSYYADVIKLIYNEKLKGLDFLNITEGNERNFFFRK